MTYQQETDATKLGAVAKYLAIPVPSSEICQINAFGAALTLVDQWRYSNNDDPNEDNATSQWHENNYPFWIAGYILDATETMKFAIVSDQKTQGSNGGTFTAGAWRQRDLNTEIDPDGIISVSANAVTVAESGKYYIRASAPAYGVNRHQCRLMKGGAFLAQGTSEYCLVNSSNRAVVTWAGNLLTGDIITLEHKCGVTFANYGFGVGDNVDSNSDFGVEVFSVMEIIQYN